MRALIDTCIIIDALQNREPFAADAQAILLASANKQFDGFISAKSVTDICYLTHRLTHCDKDTRGILNRLFVLFNVLDTAEMDCRKAIASNTADYEDAVMIETAVRSGMDCIVTNRNAKRSLNTKDYTAAPLPVYAPSDFLKELNTSNDSDLLN